MESLGKLKMTRFCGTVEYDVSKANVRLSTDHKSYIFEIEETNATAGDTSELEDNPSMEAFYYETAASFETLLGQDIRITKGYDSNRQDHVATFNLVEFEDLNENIIRVLEVQPNRVRVKWTATTQDPVFYDGSKPAAIIECETWMTAGNLTPDVAG